MRLPLLLASIAAAGLTAGSAVAQDAPAPTEAGRYGAALGRMLHEIGWQRCPADIMGEALRAACTEQLPQLTPALADLGTIDGVTFVEAGEQPPYGRVEAWTVQFSVGHTMTWVVGGERDGRFDILYPVGG
ncbi:hypothetical protein [Brevundimonas sp.]|uniref:hypothetical protein n=1 Tax=Brevundimonas sp. TaxID=1871086 RepID=UPI002D63DB0E|nr:hypothetical protein [Brevundimonas sp.]HYC67007.1 hypothetical protein [Brevundimonas sp.]